MQAIKFFFVLLFQTQASAPTDACEAQQDKERLPGQTLNPLNRHPSTTSDKVSYVGYPANTKRLTNADKDIF